MSVKKMLIEIIQVISRTTGPSLGIFVLNELYCLFLFQIHTIFDNIFFHDKNVTDRLPVDISKKVLLSHLGEC